MVTLAAMLIIIQVSLCQHWLKLKHEIVTRLNIGVWVVQLNKLLAICCRYVVGGYVITLLMYVI